MKSIVFIGAFGVFFLLALIGIVSISPLTENPVVTQRLSYFIEKVFPQRVLTLNFNDGASHELSAIVEEQPLLASPVAAPPQVLGLQTTVVSLSPSTLYGLISGSRRDRSQSVLTVNPSLEKAATELLTLSHAIAEDIGVDAESVIRKNGFDVRTFTILTAPAVISNWACIQEWQTNPRSELLLHSDTFSEMGLAMTCGSRDTDECEVLLILATAR